MTKTIWGTALFLSGLCQGCLFGAEPVIIEETCGDVECGTVSVDGKSYSCGVCGGETTYCSDEGQCVDDCEARECGPSPVEGVSCGTCTGETEVCNEMGMCEDDCTDRECGESPTLSLNCGTCSKISESCISGLCVDDCATVECGESPTLGVDCGSCDGATEQCILGDCVDDCEGLECGVSPSGFECGTCGDDLPQCLDNKCVDDCGDKVCGTSPNGFSCGSCDAENPLCWNYSCTTLESACDGTVAAYDSTDGVCWEGGRFEADYQGAKDYCEQMVLGGHDDWVVPGVAEFVGLLVGCGRDTGETGIGDCDRCTASDECVDILGDSRPHWTGDPSPLNNMYWSAELSAIDYNLESIAHFVQSRPSEVFWVRCVRINESH